MNDFAAITCYFNPCGYEARQRVYGRFAANLERQGVELWTIEASLPRKEFQVPEGQRVVRRTLPGDDWLWQKERLLNLLIAELPPRIQKIAWLDGDLLFQSDQWATMASQALDTWPVIQPFENACWLGPDEQPIPWPASADPLPSCGYMATHHPGDATNFRFGAVGLAWAARRELLQQHGLYEHDIAGGADALMALAFFGRQDHPFLNIGNAAMVRFGRAYIDRVYGGVRGFVGYSPGLVSHLWHGRFRDRQYWQRRRRLAQLGYDPARDIEEDPETGLLRWSPAASSELRAFLKSFFAARQEDQTR